MADPSHASESDIVRSRPAVDVPPGRPLAGVAFFFAVVLGVMFATLVPIELRPATGLPADIERFGAFLVGGAAWRIAFPRAAFVGCVLLVLCAAGLELMQTFVDGRHGSVLDFVWKGSGAAFGVMLIPEGHDGGEVHAEK